MSNIVGDVSNAGIFAVYWETTEHSTRTETPGDPKDLPDSVKCMIAQNLLDQLGINIRLEPKRSK